MEDGGGVECSLMWGAECRVVGKATDRGHQGASQVASMGLMISNDGPGYLEHNETSSIWINTNTVRVNAGDRLHYIHHF